MLIACAIALAVLVAYEGTRIVGAIEQESQRRQAAEQKLLERIDERWFDLKCRLEKMEEAGKPNPYDLQD